MAENKQTVKEKTKELPGLTYSDPGCRMAPVYERKFNEKLGRAIVVKTGEFDIDEFIQASNCQTDLAMLRAEMISTGQIPSVGDEVIDATLFPENIHEVYDTIKSVDKVYNDLPDSVKNIFKTKDEFLAALVAGNYQQQVINGLSKNEGQIKQEEKKESEVTAQ